MADPKQEVASSYGEGDIEAKSMTEAAADTPPSGPAAPAKVPPKGVALPVAGTTETDLAANLRQKAERDRKP